jgi:hypothetical protein
MFLASILRGVMHVIRAVQDANMRKAEREIARYTRRIRGI